ncbi:MAG: SlyX family protein [Opitutales bacterium]
MTHDPEFSHLEQVIRQLKNHIAEQDTEIFRLSKRLAAAVKRLEKLESRLASPDVDSPVDPERTVQDERPPHY